MLQSNDDLPKGDDRMSSRELQLARALAEYMDRCIEDESVDSSAFLKEHPELAAELEAELQAVDEIVELLGGVLRQRRFGECERSQD